MDKKMKANEIISNILRYGSYLSILFMAIGLFLFLAAGTYTDLSEIPNQGIKEALKGLTALDPISFMTVGIVILLLTPFLRVLSLLGIYLFVEKDRHFAMISFGVLLILIVSMLIPGIKGH